MPILTILLLLLLYIYIYIYLYIYIFVWITWPVVGIFECERQYLMQNRPGQFVHLEFVWAHANCCLTFTYTIHCLCNTTQQIVQYSILVQIPVLTVFLCTRALIARVSLGCIRRLHEFPKYNTTRQIGILVTQRCMRKQCLIEYLIS